MVYFRKRISATIIQEVNKKMVQNAREEKELRSEKKSEDEREKGNRGKLLRLRYCRTVRHKISAPMLAC